MIPCGRRQFHTLNIPASASHSILGGSPVLGGGLESGKQWGMLVLLALIIIDLFFRLGIAFAGTEDATEEEKIQMLNNMDIFLHEPGQFMYYTLVETKRLAKSTKII